MISLVPDPVPFCVVAVSCLGLSRLVLALLAVSPVVGRTRGSVASPLLCTDPCPLLSPLVCPVLAAAATLVTLPLLTRLPLMLMLSQLSWPWLPCWLCDPLNRVPGPPINLDFRGGKC